jgi:hypothetical protein
MSRQQDNPSLATTPPPNGNPAPGTLPAVKKAGSSTFVPINLEPANSYVSPFLNGTWGATSEQLCGPAFGNGRHDCLSEDFT